MLTKFLKLNWQTELEQIISHLSDTTQPALFFNLFNENLSRFEDPSIFYRHFQELPLTAIKHDHQEFIRTRLKGDYPPSERKDIRLKGYAQLYSEDKSWKIYDNQLPTPFISDFSSVLEPLKHSPVTASRARNYYTRFFLGFKGSKTEPHYDWSCYHNILWQIFGTKKVYLLSPEYLGQLESLSNFLMDDLDGFVTRCKQKNLPLQEFTIGPGEGLFIPHYFIHAVEYISDSASVGVRLLPCVPLIKIHRQLPANSCLANLCFESITRPDTQSWIEKLLQLKDYSDVIQFYSERSVLKASDAFSVLYERTLFEHQQTFEFQLELRRSRAALASTGAAFFET